MGKQHALLHCMDNKLFLHLLVVFTALLLGVSASTCGYEACPPGKPDMLNVHIICHTHDDVGWLHTVDTYYDMWVKDIINSVISNLMQDENRKFIYVESAFFSMWWEQQTDLVREYVTRLVNDGRLEFISGGWSMNDEATTHYLAIIDQMTLGLRWLNDTFGSCASPKVGWQIDTFGHSKEQASLFSQMYFDGQFIGRIHYQDKIWRQNTKTMEFVWHASKSLGEKADLFTGVLPNVYWPPKGFCFDSFCADEELSEYNIDTKAQKFITLAEDQAKHYASKHIVMTMGMDFQYRDASKWYRNLDMLISHINSLQAVGIKVNMFYSTPTCYLHSLHQANITWPTMKTDFFPYASKQHEYWTGYFTSRPSFKYYVRKSNSFFQVCKQLVALSNLHDADILTLYKALGVVQHHDGITGTEKQHVANDYAKQLSNGIGLCEDAIQEALKNFIFTNETTLNRTFNSQNIYFCHSLNISQCDFTEQENEFFVLVYNSLGHSLNTFIRFPVTGEGYEVRQVSESSLISAQVIPIPPAVLSLPERASLAVNELVFPATLSPLGLSVYSIQVLDNFVPVNDMESGRLPASIQDAVIENEHLQVVIDGYSGLMKEIIVLATNTTVPVKQSFYYYEGMPGYRLERASGAYAFNPQFDLAFSLSANITYRIFKGSLVEEVHQYYTSWISQVIRIYRGQNHVEFDWVVGPIPVHDNIGREIITRFDTNLETNGTFFTDCNGRETLKRVRNNQATWPWNITEQVAGNYYPVNSWIYIQDETKGLQLSILTDRAQGGSSISDGSVELMVNRRLLFDDGFGVSEALNEPGHDGRGLIVRGTHYLTIGPINDVVLNKYLAKKIFHTPVISFIKQNYTSALETSLKEFYGLNQQLPPNVHLLTLERLDSHRILLRLEHFYEKDDPELSNPVTFSIANLFTPFRVVYYQETTLSANKYLYEVERLKWFFTDQQVNSESNSSQDLNSEINIGQEINDEQFNSTAEELHGVFNEGAELADNLSDNNDTSLNIILRPMEIRTFIVKVEHKTEV